MSNYQMPVLTEQEKEDLPIECFRMIADAMKRGASYRQVVQMKLARIALAALTAKPVAVTDTAEINGLDDPSWVGNFLPVGFKGIDDGTEVLLYTAPTVPVIKQEGEQSE